MVSKQLHTAMLLLALAASSASAQSSNTGLSRAEVQADLQAWQQAGLDRLYRQESGPDIASPEYRQAFERYLQLRLGADYPAPGPLTREQVRADLANWKKAGMEEFSRSNSTPSFESPEYRRAYETYLRLSDAQPRQSGLSRSEVQADWQAWQSAGLARLWQNNQSPDTSSAAYQSALREYERLRQNR